MLPTASQLPAGRHRRPVQPYRVRLRTGLVVSVFIGALWVVIAAVFHQGAAEVALGAGICAAAVTALGLDDWLQR